MDSAALRWHAVAQGAAQRRAALGIVHQVQDPLGEQLGRQRGLVGDFDGAQAGEGVGVGPLVRVGQGHDQGWLFERG